MNFSTYSRDASSVQTCSTNLTSTDVCGFRASYPSSSKYLELFTEQEFTDADGYQIPIGKMSLRNAFGDKSKLINTIGQVTSLCSDDQGSSEHQKAEFFRNCSPPPTYSQVFRPGDSRNSITHTTQSLRETFCQSLLVENSTKNLDLVNNENQKQSSGSSKTTSSSSCESVRTATPPTISGALLKTASACAAPSRTMAEIKYCFDENGLQRKRLQSKDLDYHVNYQNDLLQIISSSEDDEDDFHHLCSGQVNGATNFDTPTYVNAKVCKKDERKRLSDISTSTLSDTSILSHSSPNVDSLHMDKDFSCC